MVRVVLIPLGSLVLGALGLFSGKTEPWVTNVAVAYLSIVTVAILIPPLLHATKWIRQRLKQHHLSTEFRSRLLVHASDLAEFVSDNHTHSTLYLMKTVASQNVALEHINLSGRHFSTLSAWLHELRARPYKHRIADLRGFASEISMIAVQIAALCEDCREQVQRVVAAATLPEHRVRELRQSWNSLASQHNYVLNALKDTGAALNLSAGEKLASDYYPLVKQIEA